MGSTQCSVQMMCCETVTGNLYNFVHQCHPYKFSNKEKKSHGENFRKVFSRNSKILIPQNSFKGVVKNKNKEAFMIN